MVAGVTYQGWDVQITAYGGRDWRANFFPAGIAHSILGGTAREPTPWRTVQRAAWLVVGAGRELPSRPAPVAYGQGHSGVGGHAAATGVGPIAT